MPLSVPGFGMADMTGGVPFVDEDTGGTPWEEAVPIEVQFVRRDCIICMCGIPVTIFNTGSDLLLGLLPSRVDGLELSIDSSLGDRVSSSCSSVGW